MSQKRQPFPRVVMYPFHLGQTKGIMTEKKRSLAFGDKLTKVLEDSGVENEFDSNEWSMHS